MDLEPGIYKNIPYDVYAAWPAIRASTLNACVRSDGSHSMLHGRQSEIAPKEDTDATAFGTAFHMAWLEPERFDQYYAVAPECDKRTPEGDAEWIEFLSKQAGYSAPAVEKRQRKKSPEWATFLRDAERKATLTHEEKQHIVGMTKALASCRDADMLMRNVRARELSIVWRDEETGLLCKGRIDVLSVLYDRTYIVDLKSCVDASRNAFRRQSERFGYYRSLSWYRWGLSVLHPASRRAAFLAIEKTPPYAAAVYELTDNALAAGLNEMRELLRKYDRSLKSGIWPAYGDDIKDMDLSPWLQKDLGFV